MADLVDERAVGLLQFDRRARSCARPAAAGKAAAGGARRPHHRLAGGFELQQVEPIAVLQVGRHPGGVGVERRQELLAQRQHGQDPGLVQQLAELVEKLFFAAMAAGSAVITSSNWSKTSSWRRAVPAPPRRSAR